jgi:hypothetical protein
MCIIALATNRNLLCHLLYVVIKNFSRLHKHGLVQIVTLESMCVRGYSYL